MMKRSNLSLGICYYYSYTFCSTVTNIIASFKYVKMPTINQRTQHSSIIIQRLSFSHTTRAAVFGCYRRHTF